MIKSQINIRNVVTDILNLQATIAPTLALIEEKEDLLRAYVASNDNVGIKEIVTGLGYVSVGAASVSKLTGTQDVLVLEKWLDLSLAERTKLQALGLVVTEKKYSQNRKSAVSVKLDAKAVGPNPNPNPAPVGLSAQAVLN